MKKDLVTMKVEKTLLVRLKVEAARRGLSVYELAAKLMSPQLPMVK